MYPYGPVNFTFVVILIIFFTVKKKMKIFISTETDTGFNVKDKNTEITDTVYTFIQDTTKAQGDDIATYAYKATFPLLVLKKESTTSFTAVFQGSGNKVLHKSICIIVARITLSNTKHIDVQNETWRHIEQ